MPTKNMWMVRAGEGADAIEDFRSKSVVAIGWEEGGDWTKYPNRDAIQARLAEVTPENTNTQNLVGARQIERFLRVFRVGDRVITYDPREPKVLYVSTGGFTREAQYEAERSNIPLTLMDLDELAKAVAEYYDRMDTETRSLVPLIRVYWPS